MSPPYRLALSMLADCLGLAALRQLVRRGKSCQSVCVYRKHRA